MFLHNTHQKINYQTLFLYSEKQNSCKTTTGQKFGLTPETGLCSTLSSAR